MSDLVVATSIFKDAISAKTINNCTPCIGTASLSQLRYQQSCLPDMHFGKILGKNA